MEERVNEKEEIDEEGEEEEKDIARYGSVRSMQCSAVGSCSPVGAVPRGACRIVLSLHPAVRHR